MKTRHLGIIVLVCALIACTIPFVHAADDESVALYNQADRLINAGDYRAALSLLDRALELNTSQFVSSGARQYALLDKSKAQIELGDNSGALSTIDLALAIEETDKLWNNKGYVLFLLGRYDESLSAYDSAIRITPKYTVALINKGDSLMKLGRYQDAVDTYTLAFESDAPANDLTLSQKAKTWKDTGDAYYSLGKYQEAVGAYKNSLAFNPANADAAAGLARAQRKASEISPVLVVAAIAAVAIVGGAVYYLARRQKTAPPREEKQGRKK
jgi:tetratricopeptide (TPR) repeat protein